MSPINAVSRFFTKKAFRSKCIKVVAITCILLISIFISIFVCLKVAETFFFDQVLYRKSALHGYRNHGGYDPMTTRVSALEHWLTNQREHDIQNLLNSAKTGKTHPSFIKRPHVKQIAVIGDSYTYGTGVLTYERYTKRLEKLFAESGTPVRVYNFSEPGNTLFEDYVLYELVKTYVDPDIIIIGIVANDLLFNPNRYQTSPELESYLTTNCQQQLLQITERNYKNTAEYFEDIVKSFDQKNQLHCFLYSISNILSFDKKVIIYSFYPDHPHLWCDSTTESTLDQVTADYEFVFKFSGIPVINTNFSELGSNSPNVSKSEQHPSRYLHAVFAREIKQAIDKLHPELTNK